MRVTCDSCGASYELEPRDIPSGGASIRCSVCEHTFAVERPKPRPSVADEILDLPGPKSPRGSAEGSGAFEEVIELPGLPSADRRGSAEDLPGLRGIRRRARARASDPDLEDAETIARQEEIVELPGLVGQRDDAAQEIADLPGLPSSRRGPDDDEGMDLPGLRGPGRRGRSADDAQLPGLRGRSPASTGRSRAAPRDAPAIAPPALRAGSKIDMRGFDLEGGPSGASSGGAEEGISDLPAPSREIELPAPSGEIELSAPSGEIDLPAPSGGIDLPAPSGGIDLPAPSGGIDLPAPSGAIELPAPSGEIDLPAPSGRSDLPAPSGEIDLPAPSGGIDLPAPSGGIDLPAPSGGIDLPAPSGGIDLPAPSASIDLPEPRTGPASGDPQLPGGTIDLPRPSGGIDLPLAQTNGGRRPADLPGLRDRDDPHTGGATHEGMRHGEVDLGGEGGDVPLALEADDLPAGTIDLPGPRSDSDPGAAPRPTRPSSEVLRFEPPREGADAGGAAGATPVAARTYRQGGVARLPKPAGERKQGRKSSRLLVAVAAVVGIVGLGGVAIGLFTDYGLFGAKLLLGPDTSSVRPAIERSKQLLRHDTYDGYRTAASALEAAIGSKAPASVAVAEALHLEALAAQVVRFGQRSVVSEAGQIAQRLRAVQQPRPPEVQRAEALLLLARGEKKQAAEQLTKIASQAPKDAQAALYLGWAELARARPKAAKSALLSARAIDGEHAGVSFAMARAELALERDKPALRWIERTLSRQPHHVGALLLRARLSLDDEPTQAEQTLDRVAKLLGKMARSQVSELHTLRALLAQKRGRIDDARKALKRAIAADPHNDRALVAGGRLALRAHNYAQALALFKRARGVAPKDMGIKLLVAEALLANGELPQAREELAAVLAARPDDARARLIRGRVLRKLRQNSAAVAAYRKAIELQPKKLAPYLELSQLYLEMKRTERAFDALDAAKKAVPEAGAALLTARGEAYAATDRPAKAREQFEAAIVADASSNRALFGLAGVLLRLHKTDEALAKYEMLAKRDHDYPGLGAALGQLYLRRRDYDKAKEVFERALEARKTPQLRLGAGRVYVALGKLDQALAQADKLLGDAPNHAGARGLRARVRLAQDKPALALAELKQALERKRTAELVGLQARAFEQAGKSASALRAYDEALKLAKAAGPTAPQLLPLRLGRARLLVRLGTVKDGLAELRKLAAKHPDNAEVDLLTGIAYADLRQESKARAAFKRALVKNPKLAEADYRLGVAAYDARRFPAAIARLQRALKHARSTARWRTDAYFSLGQAARAAGRKRVAKKAYKRFLQLAPKDDASRPAANKALVELSGGP